MKSVLAAEPAVLLEFKSVRIVLFVLLCVIVSLLALCTNQSNLDSCIISHFFGTSRLNLFDAPSRDRHPCTSLTERQLVRAFRHGANGHSNKAYSQRYQHYITIQSPCQ